VRVAKAARTLRVSGDSLTLSPIMKFPDLL